MDWRVLQSRSLTLDHGEPFFFPEKPGGLTSYCSQCFHCCFEPPWQPLPAPSHLPQKIKLRKYFIEKKERKINQFPAKVFSSHFATRSGNRATRGGKCQNEGTLPHHWPIRNAHAITTNQVAFGFLKKNCPKSLRILYILQLPQRE